MLRDKFAMAAMQGIVSDKKQGHTDYGHLAKDAYKIADAMMKERANWDFSGDPDFMEFKYIPPVAMVAPSGKTAGEFLAKHVRPAPVEEWKPDWSQAPEGAKAYYIEINEDDGSLEPFWVDSDRTYFDGEMFTGFKCAWNAPSFNYQGDWRESLRKRPTE